MSNSTIWPIDRSLLGIATLSQSGPGSNGNEGVLLIPQTYSKDSVGEFYNPNRLHV